MKDVTKVLGYQILVSNIFEGVRDMARRISGTGESGGRVRISIRPFTKEADDFMGGLGNFERHQHVGPGGCIPLPNDTAVYGFEKVLRLGPSDERVISLGSHVRNSFTVSATIRKRRELNRQDEGVVLTYDDWAQISVTVSGGQSKFENMGYASTLSETVEKFFAEYNDICGYGPGTFAVASKKGQN